MGKKMSLVMAVQDDQNRTASKRDRPKRPPAINLFHWSRQRHLVEHGPSAPAGEGEGQDKWNRFHTLPGFSTLRRLV